MKEELITFETAKLAEEKGYPFEFAGDVPTNIPTQSLLQKWLREEQGYYVIIIPTITIDWTFKVLNTMKKDSMEVPPYTNVCGQDFSTYEEALEAGLQEALKLIES